METPRKFQLTELGKTILRIENEREEAAIKEFHATPCSVDTCPCGKPERWNALGEDSPSQVAAIYKHFEDGHVTP